ncbi:ATP-binding cassette domain-containing protein [Micromonospora sp. KC606]|uniref:energy-coupling factor ABC transporter ATP-binding protein n=1 Tax=Micromonospora sp. KC606 TaxID=2530379 RepID=UPI00104E3A6E|nr:ATP-binding cassette domain-containing protein [Micromonospora sp. KC606]TDC85631.1 ATP-binding cassette domain-containing protein [Micromonospora sp. KC606]
MTGPLLEFSGVHFAYQPDRPVLTGADFRVEAGRRLAVVGPNGGGKTTLFRLAAGSLTPRSGHVAVAGSRVRHTRAGLRAVRQQVQLVVQDPDDQLFSASVRQDVSFGPVNLGLPPEQVRQRCDQALAALGVTSVADRPTHLLSYGQRKRVAIAGAVAMRPRLLILDEPTAGLDPVGVEELLRTLDDLYAGGTTVVLSTHDVDLAFRWADTVAVVTGGGVRTVPAAEGLADPGLLAAAYLSPAWAPLVHRLLDRTPGLAGSRPRTAAELAALLTGEPERAT